VRLGAPVFRTPPSRIPVGASTDFRREFPKEAADPLACDY
jgi:hypothetical protein